MNMHLDLQPMTARDRSELAKLVRQRERVAKTDARKRSARLKADAAWNDLVTLAQEGIGKINQQLAGRARAVGLPKKMGYPKLSLGWNVEDSEYCNRDRRSEIRRMVDSRIADLQATAMAEIERRSLDAQTEILAGGLTSDAARAVLASLPTVEALMPSVDLTALELVMPGLSRGEIASTVATIQGADLAALQAATQATALQAPAPSQGAEQ